MCVEISRRQPAARNIRSRGAYSDIIHQQDVHCFYPKSFKFQFGSRLAGVKNRLQGYQCLPRVVSVATRTSSLIIFPTKCFKLRFTLARPTAPLRLILRNKKVSLCGLKLVSLVYMGIFASQWQYQCPRPVLENHPTSKIVE